MTLVFYGVFIRPSPTGNLLKNLNSNFILFSITVSVACKTAVDILRYSLSYKINKKKDELKM